MAVVTMETKACGLLYWKKNDIKALGWSMWFGYVTKVCGVLSSRKGHDIAGLKCKDLWKLNKINKIK
jgi:hypothetical protein